MGKYGNAAVSAARYLQSGRTDDPKAAWNGAVREVFPKSESQRKKGCPRGAFLGLCEEGMIVGVPRGKYTQSKLNKDYAVRAVRLIHANPSLADDTGKLWRCVIGHVRKVENGQMDVVVALLNAGLTQLVGVSRPPGS